MKKIFKIVTVYVLFISAVYGQSESIAPVAPNAKNNFAIMDIYMISPRNLNGLGFGMGVFSPALGIGASNKGLNIRLGGDYFFSGLDRKTIHNVPLLAPQTGNAKVRLTQNFLAVNAAARLSLPWNEKVSPYADFFAGFGMHTTGITVTPNEYQLGYERSTSNNIDAVARFNYGAAAGILISLHQDVKLNAAILYTHTDNPGQITDLRSAGVESGNLLLNKKGLENGSYFFKLGITVLLRPSGKTSSNCPCNCRTATTVGVGNFIGGSSGAPNRIGTGVRITR